MLSVLIEGTLLSAPVQRTSAKGSAFVTAQVRANAEDGESVFCSVIAFSASAAEALARLGAGDTVAIAGSAALSQWEKNGEHKVGLKVTATKVLTVYEAGMRRKAASARHDQGQGENRGAHPAAARPAPPERNHQAGHPNAPSRPGRLVDLDDDIPV